jgi:hypothetical protein
MYRRFGDIPNSLSKQIQKENLMKLIKMLFVVLMVLFLGSPNTEAGDFDWIQDFNIKADIDPSGFRASLAARFKIGNVEIEAVLSNVEKPADAYMVFRLGEMSGQSTDYVVEKYKGGKGKGWGALAKSLGIKPGSREFHALKRSQDLYGTKPKDKGKAKGKNKAKGKK